MVFPSSLLNVQMFFSADDAAQLLPLLLFIAVFKQGAAHHQKELKDVEASPHQVHQQRKKHAAVKIQAHYETLFFLLTCFFDCQH